MRKSIMTMMAGMFAAMLMAGCSSNQNGGSITGINDRQARDMTSARTEFETSDDPPVSAATHFAAGQLNETQGAMAQAIEQYEASLRQDPKFVPALYRLACLYSQLKQYPPAIATWNRYIDATGQSAVGYSNLAFCQELAGDAKAAEESYLAGVEREGSNKPCRVNYGLMLARQGRLDEAREQFAAVLSPAEAHYNVASVLQQQGKKEAARAEFAEAIRSNPKFSDAQLRLAELERN